MPTASSEAAPLAAKVSNRGRHGEWDSSLFSEATHEALLAVLRRVVQDGERALRLPVSSDESLPTFEAISERGAALGYRIRAAKRHN